MPLADVLSRAAWVLVDHAAHERCHDGQRVPVHIPAARPHSSQTVRVTTAAEPVQTPTVAIKTVKTGLNVSPVGYFCSAKIAALVKAAYFPPDDTLQALRGPAARKTGAGGVHAGRLGGGDKKSCTVRSSGGSNGQNS